MATKKKKTQPDNNLIASPEPQKTATKKSSNKKSVSNDIIGSNIPDLLDVTATTFPAERKETVALFSTRNVNWEGVGKLEKGYNIVKKAEADKWLTRGHVRLATPEELAREYGV
jgi:hypothetical protein